MFILFLLVLIDTVIVRATHFNGGSITWSSINPSDNSSSIGISITQSYSWSYPTISCLNDIPISSGGYYIYLNTNLTCVANCSTDGGYSNNPVNILTDCTSISSSLGLLSSERSVNITLNGSVYFWLAYRSLAWRS